MSHYFLDKLPVTPSCRCGEDEEVRHSYFLEGHAESNNNPNVNYPFFFMVQAALAQSSLSFIFNSDIMTELKCIIMD